MNKKQEKLMKITNLFKCGHFSPKKHLLQPFQMKKKRKRRKKQSVTKNAKKRAFCHDAF